VKKLSLYVAKGITTSSTLIVTVFVAKVSGVEFFGVFNLLLTLTFILNLVSDWGFPMYGPAEMNAHVSPEEKRTYLDKVNHFRFGLSLAISVIYLVCLLLFYRHYFHLLVWGVLIVSSNFFNSDWVSRGYHLNEVSAIRQVVNAILNLVFVISIYYFKLPVISVFITYSVSIVTSYLVGVILLQKRNGNTYFAFRGWSFMFRHFPEVFTKTKYPFLGLLLFNIVYSLNVPLMAKFSLPYEASLYSSYYTIFSSAAALLLITQDVYLPQFRHDAKQLFFSKYSTVLAVASLMFIIVLLLIPFYYQYLFPASFRVDDRLTSLFVLLAFFFFLRIFIVNSALLTNEHKKFYMSNVVGFISYAVYSVVMIVTGSVTAINCVAGLLVSEAMVIAAMLILNSANLKVFLNWKIGLLAVATIILLFLSYISPQYHVYLLLALLLSSSLFFLQFSLKRQVGGLAT
jgi:O-antigen/teichoic acid export membrane protein